MSRKVEFYVKVPVSSRMLARAINLGLDNQGIHEFDSNHWRDAGTTRSELVSRLKNTPRFTRRMQKEMEAYCKKDLGQAILDYQFSYVEDPFLSETFDKLNESYDRRKLEEKEREAARRRREEDQLTQENIRKATKLLRCAGYRVERA